MEIAGVELRRTTGTLGELDKVDFLAETD